MNAREFIEWQAAIEQSLSPGMYRLRVTPTAVDGSGKPVLADVSIFEFEMRPATADAQPELAVRDVYRHYLDGTPDAYVRAEQAIDHLLVLHPSSYVAFKVRGEIARARKNEATAVLNFRRAAAILEADQDTLLTSFMSRPQREQLLAAVRDRLRSQQ